MKQDSQISASTELCCQPKALSWSPIQSAILISFEVNLCLITFSFAKWLLDIIFSYWLVFNIQINTYMLLRSPPVKEFVWNTKSDIRQNISCIWLLCLNLRINVFWKSEHPLLISTKQWLKFLTQCQTLTGRSFCQEKALFLQINILITPPRTFQKILHRNPCLLIAPQ